MPNSESPLLQAERRNWKYWREDGIPHLLGGLFVTAFGGLASLVRQYPASPWMVTLPMGLLVVWLLGSRHATQFLKARLTWPRTGYVRPPFFAGLREPLDPPVQSLLRAEESEAELQALRRRRYRRTLVLIALLMTLDRLAQSTGWRGMPVLWATLGLGAALTLYGLTRLLLFLRRHPLERA